MKRLPKDVAFTNFSLGKKPFKKGHNYISVLSGSLAGFVTDVQQGRCKNVTIKWLSQVMTKQNRASVKTELIYACKAYFTTVEEALPMHCCS
jgi:hypothetical protein